MSGFLEIRVVDFGYLALEGIGLYNYVSPTTGSSKIIQICVLHSGQIAPESRLQFNVVIWSLDIPLV